MLISDNEETAHYFTEQLCSGGSYSMSVERSAVAGLQVAGSVEFDMVIMQWFLPDMDGGQLVRELRSLNNDVPLVFICDGNKPDDMREIARLEQPGVCQIVTKPFQTSAVMFAVRNGLEARAMLSANRRLCAILKEQNSGLQKQNALLTKRVEESTRNLTRLYENLRSTYLRTIMALAQAIEARDPYTRKHSENVSRYAVAIAKEMGYTVKELETLQEAAELHDIGKIGISDLILLKASSLTKEEWLAIRKHPQTGAQILEPLTFLGEVIELVRQHHEHYDGSGYPVGLKGPEILLGARILHVADAYDAMTAARSYRMIPLPREQAFAELVKNAGTQFDPQVVEVMLKISNEV